MIDLDEEIVKLGHSRLYVVVALAESTIYGGTDTRFKSLFRISLRPISERFFGDML